MEKTKNVNKSEVWSFLLFVLMGGLLMGFLWRIRGTQGWGSSWGLLNCGFLFTMFIVLLKGEGKKMRLLYLAVISLCFMLTTPSWGTLLKQMTGVIFEANEVADIPSLAGSDVYCSVFSGVFLMICLGFGLASIFGILLGASYSEKQWRLRDFIILFAVFIGVDLLCKATVSHWILNLIQPQAKEVFEKGLEVEGINLSAYQVYFKHFDDLSWAKKIIGGRNYFSSVETIAHAVKAIACILTARFIIKDKTAAKIGFTVCGAFALSITVSDLFFYFCEGGYHMLGNTCTGSFITPWTCWEYFTGFIAGIIITAVILKTKTAADKEDIAFKKVPEKAVSVLTFILGYIFLIGITVVRPMLERYKDSDMQLFAVIIAVVAAIALVAVFAKKWGVFGEKVSLTEMSFVLLPLLLVYEYIAYMLLGTADQREFANIGSLYNISVTVSAIVLLLGVLAIKKCKKIK